MAIKREIAPTIQALSSIDVAEGTASIAKYAKEIANLDNTQRAAVFSARKVTDSQKESILQMIEMANSVRNLTVAQAESESSREAGAFATHLNAQATDKLTASMLLELVAAKKIDVESAKRLVMTGAQTAANAGLSFSFEAVAASAKSALAAMAVNPMTWIQLAIAAIPILIAGWKLLDNAFVITAEKAREKADELHASFEELESDLDSVSSKLETSRDRLAELLELKDAGTITIVQQEELDNLQSEIRLLEQRQRFLDAQKAYAAEESNEALEKAFNKEKFSPEAYSTEIEALNKEREELLKFKKTWSDADKERYDEIVKRAAALGELTSVEAQSGKTLGFTDHIQSLVDRYNELKEIDPAEMTQAQIYELDILKSKLADAGKSLGEYIDQYEGGGETKDFWQSLMDMIDRTVNKADIFEKKIAELPDECSKQLSKLGSSGELTADAVDQLAADFPELQAAMDESGATAEEVAAHFNALADAQNGAGESAATYKANLSKLTDVISSVKSSYDALKSAQEDMASGGGLSTDTIEKLAKENENYLDYIYEENGVLKLNTEAWRENADAKMQSEMAEIQKEIDSLNERNRVLLDSIAYYKQMRDAGSEPDTDWGQKIAEAMAEIEKNSAAVEDNQALYSKYIALFELMRSESDETFSSLTEHLTSISGKYDLLNSAQEEFAESGNLTASTLSSIVDKFPEMEESVSLYIAGLKTSQELLDDLSLAYDTDYENYRSAVVAKMATSESFYNSLADEQKQLIAELGKAYGIDLENFKTIEQKKLAFQAEIIKQLAANYSKYANVSLEGMKAEYDHLLISGGGDSKEVQALGDAIKAIDSYNKALNDIASGAALVNLYDPKKIKSSSSSSKEIEAYIAEIDAYREAVERLRKAQEAVSGIESGIDKSDDLKEKIVLEKQLIGAYAEEQDALHHLNDQRDATITSGVQSLRDLGFSVQYNAETNELWIENMERLNELTASSKGKYDTLQEATNALREDTDDLIGTLEDLNEENREGSATWWEVEDAIHEARIAIVDDLKDIVTQASDAVDTIQDVYDTLKSAADEYAENGGFLTVDTFQKIVELGPQYMQYLQDENGMLAINEENIKKVIAAKTEQLALENALSYVERLRLATESDAVEDLNELLYATTAATDATWGLVYANLALLDLDEDQYQAALHNINSIRSMADAAVDGIGRTAGEAANAAQEAAEAAKKEMEDLLDDLEDMQDGCDDIVKYVMDMLKHRIQEQTDLLEEMKDKFSEIIDLKKESLKASKDEEDYQKTIAKKLKEMAKLQERINALSLDDSRSAQAEKAKLLEELAELQDELNDTQTEKSIEAAEDALDKMEDAYHQEKDEEIKILEDSVSSYQKLYDMAINYIREHWDTLYSELISWNTEYGSVLNSEISDAWDNCQAAAQRYGDFVTAMMGGIKNEIAEINAQIESLSVSGGSYGTTGSGASNSNNTVVGEKKNYEDDYTSGYTAKISDYVAQMRENSKKWHTASAAEQSRLHDDSDDLAAKIRRLGVDADYDDRTGEWIIRSDRWNPSFVGRKLFDVYHNGGVVGGGTVKENEQLALLKKKEWVLNDTMIENVSRMIRWIKILGDKFAETPLMSTQPIIPALSQLGGGTVNNIVNKNSNQPIQINIGDTVIHGNASPETVNAHMEVNRTLVNDIAKRLGIRR